MSTLQQGSAQRNDHFRFHKWNEQHTMLQHGVLSCLDICIFWKINIAHYCKYHKSALLVPLLGQVSILKLQLAAKWKRLQTKTNQTVKLT